jgi:hypothetical protein
VIWTLRQVLSDVSSAGWFLWLLRLVLDFLRDHLLELEERYPLWNTYCMSA